MKKKAVIGFIYATLLMSGFAQAQIDNYTRIPPTLYQQPYGDTVVHTNFPPIDQVTLTRWSLARTVIMRLLGWPYLELAPNPTHTVLVSQNDYLALFPGDPPGAYRGFNFNFFFPWDISQGTTLSFLENENFYVSYGGDWYILRLMLDKFLRWTYQPGVQFSNQYPGYNPLIVGASKYAVYVLTSKTGQTTPDVLDANRFNELWDIVKEIAQGAGFPRDFLNQITKPPINEYQIEIYRRLQAQIQSNHHFECNDTGTSCWQVNGPPPTGWWTGEDENAKYMFSRILAYFLNDQSQVTAQLRSKAILIGLQMLDTICETRGDCIRPEGKVVVNK